MCRSDALHLDHQREEALDLGRDAAGAAAGAAADGARRGRRGPRGAAGAAPPEREPGVQRRRCRRSAHARDRAHARDLEPPLRASRRQRAARASGVSVGASSCSIVVRRLLRALHLALARAGHDHDAAARRPAAARWPPALTAACSSRSSDIRPPVSTTRVTCRLCTRCSRSPRVQRSGSGSRPVQVVQHALLVRRACRCAGCPRSAAPRTRPPDARAPSSAMRPPVGRRATLDHDQLAPCSGCTGPSASSGRNGKNGRRVVDPLLGAHRARVMRGRGRNEDAAAEACGRRRRSPRRAGPPSERAARSWHSSASAGADYALASRAPAIAAPPTGSAGPGRAAARPRARVGARPRQQPPQLRRGWRPGWPGSGSRWRAGASRSVVERGLQLAAVAGARRRAGPPAPPARPGAARRPRAGPPGRG